MNHAAELFRQRNTVYVDNFERRAISIDADPSETADGENVTGSNLTVITPWRSECRVGGHHRQSVEPVV